VILGIAYGHPANADQRQNRLRPSSAIIPVHQIKDGSFEGAIYYDDGFELVTVPVREILMDNEALLAKQLLNVEEEMDRNERTFRLEQSKRPLKDHFGVNFSYLVQRLHCVLTDSGRIPQAQTHAKMIREICVNLKEDLTRRGFCDNSWGDQFERLNTGIELLERKLDESVHEPRSQHVFDLLFSWIEKELDILFKRSLELDEEFSIQI